MVFLRKKRWEENTKTDYYLAQIAAEIRIIREGFNEKPKPVSIKDCLLTQEEEPVSPPHRHEKKGLNLRRRRSKKRLFPPPNPATAGRRAVEMGSREALEDPKWQMVTANAKAMWARRLGVKELEQLKKE